MKMLSVIIPTYNTGEELRKTLDSVLGQSYRDLEIIIIDDASQDDTPAILQEYEQQDSRIKLFLRTENVGPGACRNFGIEQASGEYLTFVDHDDWLDSDRYERMIELLEKDGTEVCFSDFQYYSVVDKKTVYSGSVFATGVVDVQDNIEKFRYNFWGPWRKIFKLSFVRRYELKFLEYASLFDDVLFHSLFVMIVEKVSWYDAPAYTQCRSDKSISTHSRDDTDELLFNYIKSLEQALESKVAGIIGKENILKYYEEYYKRKFGADHTKEKLFRRKRKWLEITTNIGCANFCKYCPQKLLMTEYQKISDIKMLSLSDFKRCINKLPREVKINFTGFSEPFFNPEAVEMVLYAAGRGREINISTTASRLTVADIYKLGKVEFGEFSLHLPDIDGLMKFTPDAAYWSKIRLCKEVFGNIKGLVIGNPYEEAKEIFGDELRQLQVISRGGILDKAELPANLNFIDEFSRKTSGKRIKCRRLHESLVYKDNYELEIFVLLPNCDLALCCMDYGLKHIVGNLKRQSYQNILGSYTYRKIIENMLKGQNTDIICYSCEYAQIVE